MAAAFDDQEMAQLKEHFELFDLQSEGFINKSDLAHAIRGYGINLTEVSLQHALEDYDNGDGRIMFTDFVELVARKMTDPGLVQEDIMDSFAVFDKEKSGKVNAEELKHVLTKMGEFMDPKEVDSIMKEAKVDSNGDFKYKDFVKYLQTQYNIFAN